MFEALGISAQQELVYRALVDEPQLARDTLSARLGIKAVELDGSISRLLSLGLLREDPVEKQLVVSDPQAALSLLLQDQQRSLDAMQKESVDLAQRLRRTRQTSELSSIIEVVTGADAITSRWEHAQKTARNCIRMTDRPPYYDGAKIEGMNTQLARMAEGLQFQTLYDARIFEHPFHLHRARVAIEAGEQARVLPEVPIKMVLIDDELAILGLLTSAEEREPTVILVYQSALLDSLSELYNLLWARGVSMPLGRLPDAAHELTESQRTLIALMASGLKDEAIAIEMGVAARTVRRKVQDIYELLGVGNRFQAGIAVKERGWI